MESAPQYRPMRFARSTPFLDLCSIPISWFPAPESEDESRITSSCQGKPIACAFDERVVGRLVPVVELCGAHDRCLLANLFKRSNHLTYVKEQIGKKSTNMPFRFLDLPREIRDEIYEVCLVSNSMIELACLRIGPEQKYITRERRFGIHTPVLRTCRQVHDEACKILYGLNLFYVGLQARWRYTRAVAFQELIEQETWARQPLACLKCSKKVRGLTSSEIAAPELSNSSEYSLETSTSCWSTNIGRVRRLYVNLRSYSYQQYHDIYAIKFHLQKLHSKQDRALVESCSHSFPTAIPKIMDLDLLVLHITKRSLVSAGDNHSLMAAFRYATCAGEWRANAQEDMAREVAPLLEFASRNAKVVVLPDRSGSQVLSDSSCFRDGGEDVCNSIPFRFLQTGFFARSQPHSSKQALLTCDSSPWLESIRKLGDTTAEEISENVERHQELLFLPTPSTIVYDCISD